MKPVLKSSKLANVGYDIRGPVLDKARQMEEDGQRIIGFGFFAGIVGAHNGMMVYGQRSGTFHLERVYKQKDFKELIHSYFGLKIPNIKVAVTGSGRVAHGILEVMNLMEVIEIPDHPWFLACQFHPEFTSTPREGHPLFTGFIQAAIKQRHHQNQQEVA